MKKCCDGRNHLCHPTRGICSMRCAPFRWLLVGVVVFVTIVITVSTTPARAEQHQPKYLLVGVSGGLQDGFPERFKMDFIDTDNNNAIIPAIYIGKTMIRGYKAYLDVMETTHRQYIHEPDQPLINSNVFATGCYAHANEYWFYMVDARQVLFVLNNEPRFLSITPDTGLVDLHLLETNTTLGLPQQLKNEYSTIHTFINEYIKQLQESTTTVIETQYVAVPLVTAVYYNPLSHVESPILHTLQDGTQVTNFPDSLAKWAKVSSTDRTAVLDLDCYDDDTVCTNETVAEAKQSAQRFWDGIRTAIRTAEQQRLDKAFPVPSYIPFSGTCPNSNQKTRFGVGPNTVRINQAFTQNEFYDLIKKMDYTIDTKKHRIVPKIAEQKIATDNNNDNTKTEL